MDSSDITMRLPPRHMPLRKALKREPLTLSLFPPYSYFFSGTGLSVGCDVALDFGRLLGSGIRLETRGSHDKCVLWFQKWL